MDAKRTKRYPTHKKILLALVSFVVGVLIAEVVLRAFDYHYRPLDIQVDGAVTDWRFKHSFADADFVYDPKLIWRPRKDRSVFNSQGFRGNELAEQKSPNEYRIFAIGDSNTLGWSSRGANWPSDLQELLPRPDDGLTATTRAARIYSVTNAGVWGYSSFQGLERLKEIVRFEPDMVLISFGSNDAHMVNVPDAHFTATFFESALGKTRIGQLTLEAWQKLAAGGKQHGYENLVRRVSLQQYRDNLKQMIEIAKANDVQCVLLTRPFVGDSSAQVRPELWWKTAAPDYVDATIEVGRDSKVLVVDVYSRFKDEEELFADESHFTEAGHQLAAEFIYERIERLLAP